MEQREYDAGDVILKEGDPSDFAYRIMSGEVEVFTEVDGQTVLVGTVKAGEFLGETGIIEGQPRSVSARAKTHVMAALLEREEFFRLMSKDGSSAYRLIVSLCERLRAASRRLAEATVSRGGYTDTIENAVSTSESENLSAQASRKSESAGLRLTLLPASQQLTSHLPKEGISVDNLPFSIGRLPRANEPGPTVPIDLSLPDSMPFRLSREHFSLSRHRGRYVVVDLGSARGTEVNGKSLRRHSRKDFEYLKMGENTITAGGANSPFIFRVFLKQA